MRANPQSILALLFGLTLPMAALAQPTRLEPTDQPPLPTNLLQVFPSNCPLKQPASGALQSYETTIGTYTAYGDKDLLPVEVEAKIEGPQPPGIRLAFGARTTIRLADSEPLNGQPYPMVPNMTDAPSAVDVVVWSSTESDQANGKIGYVFPVTAPAWEIAGTRQPSQRQHFACLYLKGDNK